VRRKLNLAQKRLEKTRKRSILRILAASDAVSTGILSYGNLHFPVALGSNGVRALKREGDGATPLGYWPLERIYYRQDRIARPRTLLRAEPIGRHSGWCDAAGDGRWVVTIRGAQLAADRRTALAHAGGGIVAESDPDGEVAETTTKFITILTALGVQP